MRTRTSRRSFLALRGLEEGRQLFQARVAEQREGRHRRAGSHARRAFEMPNLKVDAEILRADISQIRRAEVRRADVLVRVAVEAAGLQEELESGNRLRVVLEPFRLRELRRLRDQLATERLLRGCALVRQHA